MSHLIRFSTSVVSIEFRRILAYRADFWLQLFASTLAHMLAAGFLWYSIFESKGTDTIRGYTFETMLIYYLAVSFVDRAVRTGDRGQISTEIYEGTLSKFLVYPVPVFFYWLSVHVSRSLFFSIQIFLVILPLAYFLWQGSAVEFIVNTLYSFILLFTASILFFLLSSIVESVAFWADHVWSLLVLLRFLIYFCGGGLIPLKLFPDYAVIFFNFTPFPYLLSFVVQSFTATELISQQGFLKSFLIQIIWIAIASGILALIWSQGRKKYSGIGQ